MAHDIFIVACALGAFGIFIATWLIAGRLLDGVPTTFERNDFWGL